MSLELRLNPINPITEHRSGVAWVDQIVDSKALGPGVRRALRSKSFFDLSPFRFRIRRGLDLATIRDGNSTFKR
jgi:hypothetical protein